MGRAELRGGGGALAPCRVGVPVGPDSLHLTPWAEKCLLGRSHDAEVAVGELWQLPPRDTAGLPRGSGLRSLTTGWMEVGWPNSADGRSPGPELCLRTHRVGGRKCRLLGLPRSWQQEVPARGGSPGGHRPPMQPAAVSRREHWEQHRGTRPHQPGRCRPQPCAVAPEPHGLLRR